MEKKNAPAPFTSRMSRWEMIAALAWLPVHVLLLPALLVRLFPTMELTQLNLVVYCVGAAYMLLTQWRFLRRDFDPLCDRPGWILVNICVCYGAMLLFNMALVGLLSLMVDTANNPNNAAIMDMAGTDSGKVSALAVFLAPFVEELIFRGAVFGSLRHRSRILAYVVSILLFSAYHVWGFALNDPTIWIYVLQYVPVSYLLCRCYERTDTIWGSIFFHMLVNAISLRALTLLQELM